MEDLSLISFEDLISELSKRFDHMIFCGLLDSSQDYFDMKRRYFGSRATCIAAAEFIQDMIKEDLYETFKPNEDNT